MKKIYIIPTMDVIKIHTVGMLAVSNVDMNDKNHSGDASYGLSRSFSFDDEDEDEDED